MSTDSSLKSMTLGAQFEYAWQVRFVDTDASGFAHFSSYSKMMEETEYAFLRSRGLSVVMHDERGTIGFPRIAVDVSILRPLRFEERATVLLYLVELDGKQIRYEFTIVDENKKIAAHGQFVVACCRFPDDFPPYAILIPAHVEEALSVTKTTRSETALFGFASPENL
jgi:acyl-CoA thioester hydrolase